MRYKEKGKTNLTALRRLLVPSLIVLIIATLVGAFMLITTATLVGILLLLVDLIVLLLASVALVFIFDFNPEWAHPRKD